MEPIGSGFENWGGARQEGRWAKFEAIVVTGPATGVRNVLPQDSPMVLRELDGLESALAAVVSLGVTKVIDRAAVVKERAKRIQAAYEVQNHSAETKATAPAGLGEELPRQGHRGGHGSNCSIRGRLLIPAAEG